MEGKRWRLYQALPFMFNETSRNYVIKTYRKNTMTNNLKTESRLKIDVRGERLNGRDL